MARTIRNYHENDLDDVLDIWEQASRIAHSFLPVDFQAQERKNIPELYMPNAETWVIEQMDRVIGFIALLGNEVGALFVLPEFHGTGAGWALMDKAQEIHGTLEVEVFKENPIGRLFYRKYGFILMHEKIHEATGEKLLRLEFAP